MSTDERFAAATKAGEDEYAAYGAVDVRYDEPEGRVVVTLARELVLSIPPRMLQGLEQATPDALRGIELTPGGLGLHIESLDWDMSIRGIVEGRYGSPRWMANTTHRDGGIRIHPH